MGKFLDTLLGKSDQSITHSPSSVKDSRLHKSDDSYVCYCTELEQALSSLETCLLTSSNPEGIATKRICGRYRRGWMRYGSYKDASYQVNAESGH